jgi:hypothetical protein
VGVLIGMAVILIAGVAYVVARVRAIDEEQRPAGAPA